MEENPNSAAARRPQAVFNIVLAVSAALMAACALFWLIRPFYSRRAAILAIRSLPRHEHAVWTEPRGWDWLRPHFPEDWWLAYDDVRGVEAYGPDFTNAHLRSIRDLRPCESVDLLGAGVDSEGLRVLRGRTGLKTVRLREMEVDEAAFEHLATIPDLEHLSLTGSSISDSGLKRLASLARLQSLSLAETNVSDEGLKSLGECRQIEQLSLAGTRVSNDGLRHLAGMHKLKSLSLVWVGVDDEGLRILERLPSLMQLRIWDEPSRTTPEGEARFLASRPGRGFIPIGNTPLPPRYMKTWSSSGRK